MEIIFKTISPVILSPRDSGALYATIDFEEFEADNAIKIIYPFYSYEDRAFKANKAFEKAKEYFVPASSLKGALLLNNEFKELRSKVFIKDSKIENNLIELKPLYKFQYLYQENTGDKNKKNKNPVLEKFFPTLNIEMLNTDAEFSAHVNFKNPKGAGIKLDNSNSSDDYTRENFQKAIENTEKITKNKLKNYNMEIGKRIKSIENLNLADGGKDAVKALKKMRGKIDELIAENRKILFLGGYKGILGSLQNLKNEKNTIQNGFYIDTDTMLPYGLVEILYFDC